MLTLYRFDHLAQVVPELGPQVQLLEAMFGFRRRRAWEDPATASRGVLMDVPGSWGHRFEILAPTSPDSPLRSFLDRPAGPGLHHVAIEVPSVPDAARELQTLGYGDGQIVRDPGGRWIDVPAGPAQSPSSLMLRLFGPPMLGVCGRDDVRSDEAVLRSLPAPPAGDVPSLGIVAVEQVGQGVPDRDALVRWGERTLGMREVYRTPPGRWPDMATLVLTLPGTSIRWEALAPAGDDSFVQRFLDKRGPAAHHVTFEVADWKQVEAACEYHGIPFFDLNQGETDRGRWCDAFIHPRHTGGWLAQLFWEERPGIWSRSDKVAHAMREQPGGSGRRWI